MTKLIKDGPPLIEIIALKQNNNNKRVRKYHGIRYIIYKTSRLSNMKDRILFFRPRLDTLISVNFRLKIFLIYS